MMFEYTKNNHFKFGYNGLNQYQGRTGANDKFTFEYGPSENDCQNWREANNLAARMIYERKVDDIYILLSGGMDSEICLRSFLDQGLTVKTVSLKFTDIPQEELMHVERLRKQHKLNHSYVELNLHEFLGSAEFYLTTDPIKCVSPIIGCHLWMANQLPGTPVIAQGEVHLQKDVPENYVPGISPYLPGQWNLYESERLCSIYQNFMLNKRPAVPGFFQYLPEQFFTFLTCNPLLDKLLNNEIPGKLGTRSSKNPMSLQFYPELPPRDKLHGWEAVQSLHDLWRKTLAERYPFSNDFHKIEVSEAIKMLRH